MGRGLLTGACLVLAAACGGSDDAGSAADGGSAPGGASGVGGSPGVGGTPGSGGTTPVDPPDVPDVTKFDLLGAGLGSDLHLAVCGGVDACDVCEALGYAGDLECDASLIASGLCAGTDPDCAPISATYYVAPDGSDASDGSEASPFATVQQAHDVAQPGDHIYLRGGTYAPTQRTTFTAEGTAGSPIILQSYPGEEVIIDGSGVPEGDVDGPSTATWLFNGAKHWQVRGPLHLTEGRGAGLAIEGDTEQIDFVYIESSYNGRTASRGGHGFSIVAEEWAAVADVRFINCDAHHNANHRTQPGEDVAENLYQHGDGWRIKSGIGIELIGCRAWYNLDDGYDLTDARDGVLLYNCWAAYSGYDDAAGTMTGTPGFAADWGEGIKLTYDDDVGPHACVRCLSWSNVHLGYRLDGGPNRLENCSAIRNGRRALGWFMTAQPHTFVNNLDFDSYRESDIPATIDSSFNTWDAATGVSVAADDFLSVDDVGMLGPRSSDGSLPVTDFGRLAVGSDLVDAGADVGGWSTGVAPDLGCFERP